MGMNTPSLAIATPALVEFAVASSGRELVPVGSAPTLEERIARLEAAADRKQAAPRREDRSQPAELLPNCSPQPCRLSTALSDAAVREFGKMVTDYLIDRPEPSAA